MPPRPVKTKQRAELGDFQTPPSLASAVCGWLVSMGLRPASVLEPTCGTGAFLLAAHEAFPWARRLVGLDIREEHIDVSRRELERAGAGERLSLTVEDLFRADWSAILSGLPSPVLVVGNPPWVTSAALGKLESGNLPPKKNTQGLRGLDARTGRSNFDISEWLILRLLSAMVPSEGAALAMLVKTSVARKVLRWGWREGMPFQEAHLVHLDALSHFGVSVDAGLFCLSLGTEGREQRCKVWAGLEAAAPEGEVGFCEGVLVADAEAHSRARHLVARSLARSPSQASHRWRSGLKHDCAPVLELRRQGDRLVNGLGETVDVEDELIHPMLKSADLAHGRSEVRRWLLLPQRRLGEDTAILEQTAPRAWAYLQAHGALLNRRKSSIYRGRPPFSVFGVGEYSFAPWKVAVSGLYKRLSFVAVGPVEGRPVLFDDTVYFWPTSEEAEARRLSALLGGPAAADFFKAFAFWDAKRPITARLLDRLDLEALARR